MLLAITSMKKNCLYLIIILFISACAQKKKMVVIGNQNNQLSFSSIHKNLETIATGDITDFEYEFTNTGKVEVLILNAVPTCGCVSIKYPKKPILPNKSGVLKVSFDSKGKIGFTKKSIVVQTNLTYPNDIIELSFEVKVNEK